mgnify:CR=1 FL=1
MLSALRAHAPFDEMEPEALAFLASRLQLGYFPRGELLVGPERGPAERLYIVKQGSVRGTGGSADIVLGAGECFPMGALVGQECVRITAGQFCSMIFSVPSRALVAVPGSSVRDIIGKSPEV